MGITNFPHGILATPNVGATNTALLEKTKDPDPVSSEIILSKFADVVRANWLKSRTVNAEYAAGIVIKTFLLPDAKFTKFPVFEEAKTCNLEIELFEE